MRFLRNQVLLGVTLILLIIWAGAVSAQTTKTFTGKITEIAKGSQLDIAKTDIFYTIKLEEHPKIQFRLTPEDAARFGVIDKAGPTGVLTPKMNKGLGWSVKLTCDGNNLGENRAPVYKVTALVRLED
jgi:hypothetical protein